MRLLYFVILGSSYWLAAFSPSLWLAAIDANPHVTCSPTCVGSDLALRHPTSPALALRATLAAWTVARAAFISLESLNAWAAFTARRASIS